MKRYILALLCCLPLAVWADGIVVESFTLDQFDQTANTPTTEQIDQNGERCALLKVETTQKGFHFDVGTLGVWKVDENHPGEIWVWVPRGIRRITIQHAQLGTLRDYEFPIAIQSAKTYIMKLTTGEVDVIVRRTISQQFVEFHLTPKDAIIFLNDEPLPVDEEGVATKMMPFGEYSYRVEANDYYSDAGVVTVNDAKKKVVKYITLREAFGGLRVEGSSVQDGVVYIDNKRMGTAPLTISKIGSGQHRLMIVRPKYKTLEQTITITDGKTATLTPSMQANFQELTLTVADNAEIWVNGQRVGQGSYTGEFEQGSVQVECKKASHRSTSQVVTATAGEPRKTVTLQAPVPIYGEMTITTKPSGAKVLIDGVEVKDQTTPVYLTDILVGQHTVTLTKNGYDDYKQQVSISETTPANFTAALTVRKTDTPAPPSAGSSTDNTGGVQTVTVNGVSFKMVYVAGGSFTMGCTGEQGNDCYDDEKPAHLVTLSSYYIGQTEVTQGLWYAVMGSNPSGFKKGDNYPVEQVSWNDCQEFIRKLNQLTGKTFALPTEAQWEYAARGGNKSQGYKYAGSNTLGNVAWYTDNSSNSTHPVATKSPNELGLYDMSGNVWEWCQDRYGTYPSYAQTDPTGASSGSYRVYRGGGWSGSARGCRVSARYSRSPGYRYGDLGLRLVLL